MHGPLFYFWIALGASALIGQGIRFGLQRLSWRRRMVRALRGAPRVSIADVVHGETVRIVGRVLRDGPLLRAPVTNRECAHFELRIREETRADGRSASRELARSRGSCSFRVEDASGLAIVETLDFECALSARVSRPLEHVSPALEQLLARHGVPSAKIIELAPRLRCSERVLAPGDLVSVLGRARWEDDTDVPPVPSERDNYRDVVRKKRLVIEAPELGPVFASDAPSLEG